MSFSERQRTGDSRGFTLVELAIVVVVAGLILAALLLRGETVVGGARTTEAIALARDVIEAANRFRQTYRYWPG
ncbi:MAG: type II secretion system protein, partial [Pseudomonadota bacterium]